MKYTNAGDDWGILGRQGGNTLFQLGSEGGATTNKIAGWTFDNEKIYTTGVHLSASYGLRVFEDANNEVNIRYEASDNYGIIGRTSGNVTFALGANLESGVTDNEIAGWEFDNEKLTGGSMIIRKNGTIESDGFIIQRLPR